MKVWELMARLSKCRADAEVWIGVGDHYNVPAEDIEYEEDSDTSSVTISSSLVPDPIEDAG